MTLAFYDLMSSIILYSSTLRVAGIMTGTSSNVTVSGDGPDLANSLLISALTSSGIRCWSTPLPISTMGRDFGTFGVEASSQESGSETTFFYYLYAYLFYFNCYWLPLVKLRKVIRKTCPSSFFRILCSSHMAVVEPRLFPRWDVHLFEYLPCLYRFLAPGSKMPVFLATLARKDSWRSLTLPREWAVGGVVIWVSAVKTIYGRSTWVLFCILAPWVTLDCAIRGPIGALPKGTGARPLPYVDWTWYTGASSSSSSFSSG